jgi:hypothetical protein
MGVEHMVSVCKALGSIPSTKEREMKRRGGEERRGEESEKSRKRKAALWYTVLFKFIFPKL